MSHYEDDYEEDYGDDYEGDKSYPSKSSREGGPNAAVGEESSYSVSQDCEHDDEPTHVDPFHSEKGQKPNVGRRIPGKDITRGGSSVRAESQNKESSYFRE